MEVEAEELDWVVGPLLGVVHSCVEVGGNVVPAEFDAVEAPDCSAFESLSFSDDDSDPLDDIGLSSDALRSDAGCADCFVDVSAGLAIRITATVRTNPRITAAALKKNRFLYRG